jgi:hypothetical protein
MHGPCESCGSSRHSDGNCHNPRRPPPMLCGSAHEQNMSKHTRHEAAVPNVDVDDSCEVCHANGPCRHYCPNCGDRIYPSDGTVYPGYCPNCDHDFPWKTHCLNGRQCLKQHGSCICLCDGCRP